MLKNFKLAQKDVKFNYGYFAAIPKDKEIVLDFRKFALCRESREFGIMIFKR